MLSKVLTDSGVATAPLVWRGRAPRHVPPTPPSEPVAAVAPPPVSDEIVHLRDTVGQLNAQIEQQTREAFEAGLRAGETAARERLEASVQHTIAQLAGAISEIASLRAETIHRAEVDTVRLAVEIARRVLHREITVDTSALSALVKAALQKLQTQEVYRVRVHPDQAKVVRACLDEMGRSQTIEIVQDASQAQGGAVFEVTRGGLDASVETQLREIECGLTDQLEGRN